MHIVALQRAIDFELDSKLFIRGKGSRWALDFCVQRTTEHDEGGESGSYSMSGRNHVCLDCSSAKKLYITAKATSETKLPVVLARI
jgi:hypothetical protein